MITNKWGDALTIKANCGQHKPKGFKTSVTLVAVEFLEDGREAFHFAEFLRATEGWNEINQVLSQAKFVDLPKDILKKAINEAL